VCADCGYVMRFETDRISRWQEAAKPEDFSA
jgi:Fe2+ or Zn2+ uptake regulation protein